MSDPHKENKRMYALDEAAVGRGEAPKRWQLQCFTNDRWFQCPQPPRWHDDFSYRRDPEAPALPSLDWHEAPDWAHWMAKDLDDIHPAWFECKPSDKGWDLVEQRPNPEWFELTRPDYEASKENDMYEYLTGAELMYAIGDAMAAGEGPEVFEFEMKGSPGDWRCPQRFSTLIFCGEEDQRVRRKSRTPTITEALKRLTIAARTSGGTAGPDDELMDACEEAERALIAASGGSCE